MGRGPKPTKGKARPALSRKSRTNEDALVRDLEKRLTESLEREKATGRALTEALEQQTATSEVLKVISRSAFDLQPVLQTLVDNATRLCGAVSGVIWRFDGEFFRLAAERGVSPELKDSWARYPFGIGRGSATGRTALEGRTVHIPDVLADPEYTLTDAQKAGGFRTILGVPMLRDGVLVGVFGLQRYEVNPFTDRQVELVTIFADQAVIAIENVRLFKELEARNRDLTTALDRQTATSEVLRVISSSPTDVRPVFETIVENAGRLCGAESAVVYRFEGDIADVVAGYNLSPETVAWYRQRFPRPLRDTDQLWRIADGSVLNLADIERDAEQWPSVSGISRVRGIRSAVWVPMVRGSRTIGAINVAHRDVGAFSDARIQLLKTFADQAVIAIENVRLFNETKEALEQQTATSEILRVISQSPTDVKPVFDTIVRSSARLCNAVHAVVVLTDGITLDVPANYGRSSPEALAAARAMWPRPLDMTTTAGAAILTRSVVQMQDTEDPSVSDFLRRAGRLLGYRSSLAVPMLRGVEAIGAIRVARPEPTRFSDAEVELLKTFADQAVIAIENVRLFTELQARNRDLTATSEILQVISRSPTSAQPVFDTIVASATRLCEADLSGLYLFDGAIIHFAAQHGRTPEEIEAARQAFPQPVGRASVSARAILDATVVQVPDVREDPEMADALRALFRTVMAVPILRDGRAIGTITVARRVVRPFSDEQIALLQTFANQAIIAIENVGLFNELQARNREIEEKSRQLEVASQHKSEFLANMSHELRTPLNAIIGFSEVLSERMFGELNEKQEEYSKDIHASGQHLLSLINDILDLSKIEAGRMELELSDFHLPTALDSALTLVRERAGRRGIALHLSVDERLGQIQADERKVRQVVLNLLSNAIKFTPEGGRIEVAAMPKDGFVEVSVRDTGVGIAPEDQEAVFEEFRQVGTADKKVEGTGLGLTLCRKFVELHGGRIWVKSQLGVGSTFTFTIPVRPAV